MGYERYLARRLSRSNGGIAVNVKKVNSDFIKKTECIEELKIVKNENYNLTEQLQKLDDSLDLDNLLQDPALIVVLKSWSYLQGKWGDQWKESFLYCFIKFLFKNAMSQSGNGLRYNDEDSQRILGF